jgi:hypothetical protein
MPNPLNDFQSAIVLLLMATLTAALLQWKNQMHLFKATRNSTQRRICLTGASLTLAMVSAFIALFIVYAAKKVDGLPGGILEPEEWPAEVTVSAGICVCLTYAAFLVIILASLHRYRRLMAVEAGTTHEKVFKIAKYGSVICAILVSICTIIVIFFCHKVIFLAIAAIAFAWLMTVDFCANFLA